MSIPLYCIIGCYKKKFCWCGRVAGQSNKSNKFNLSIDISNKTAQELAH